MCRTSKVTSEVHPNSPRACFMSTSTVGEAKTDRDSGLKAVGMRSDRRWKAGKGTILGVEEEEKRKN